MMQLLMLLTHLRTGHDTTASAISWALYSLAENPEHQTLCQQEIDGILEGRQDDTITWLIIIDSLVT